MSRRKRLSRREQQEEARVKRRRFWISVFVIVVMVSGSVGFIATSIGGGSGQQSGYGFSYEVRDQFIVVRVDGEDVRFYNTPQGIQVPDRAGELLRGAQSVTLSFNASDVENTQFVELARFDLSTYLRVPTSAGLLASSDESSFPVVTCADATEEQPVVAFVREPGLSVSVNGSCITLAGDQTTFLLARDALLYEYFDLV